MDMDTIVRDVVRRAYAVRFGRLDSVASARVAEIKRLLTALNIGVLDVAAIAHGDNIGLRVVFDSGWEPLDESWTPGDSMVAMFNALEAGGFRHVPGTSGFDDDSTVFIKGGLEFDFARPAIPAG